MAKDGAQRNVGETNEGHSEYANILRLAAIAVAAAQAAAALKIASLQEDIAKGYLKISKEQRNYYYSTFVQYEDAEINDVVSEPLYEEKPDVIVGRMKIAARLANKDNINKAIVCSGKYCTGRTSAVLSDILIAEANAASAAANMGYRYEHSYKLSRDEVRWLRREAVLNRGRNLPAQSVSFSNLSNGIFGNLGKQVGAGLSGAIAYLGYSSERRPTVYPGSEPFSLPKRGLHLTPLLPTPPVISKASPVDTRG